MYVSGKIISFQVRGFVGVVLLSGLPYLRTLSRLIFTFWEFKGHSASGKDTRRRSSEASYHQRHY